MLGEVRVFLQVLLVSWVGVGCTEGTISREDVASNDRGVALMGRYEYAAATEMFAQVVDRTPSWLDARVNLAIATLNRQEDGDESRALKIVSGVLTEDPGHLRAIYMSGLIHLYRGEIEPATAFLRQAADADQADAYAAYFLGQAYLQKSAYADAAEWLVRSIELDPYLRSAYWAGSQALRRLGRDTDSSELLLDYKRFAPNPAARLAGFSYKRMGPKAEALAINIEVGPKTPRPAGDLFAGPILVDSRDWQDATVTAVDMDDDGQLELVVTGGDELVVLTRNIEGTFAPVGDHPLSSAATAHAAIWGDVDDDGYVDVVLCGRGGARLWRQASENRWQRTSTGTEVPCSGGALFDFDHDGDLDLFVTGDDGNELLSNNRDGSFRPLAEEMGLQGRQGAQVLVYDLDADRDLDILVINTSPPHDIWRNDRTWKYESFPGLDSFRESELVAATVIDADADGHAEIYAISTSGDLVVWRADGLSWHRDVVLASSDQGGPQVVPRFAEISAADFDGDGRLELLRILSGDIALIDTQTGTLIFEQKAVGPGSAISIPLDPDSGPSLVSVSADGLAVWRPGPGRYPFLSLVPSGRSEADQMRSNASGIGTRIKIRAAGRWTVVDALDPHSGPGQSLVPLVIGLAGRAQTDFVVLEWSDGVSQTELELETGRVHKIAETQRQLASCPVVFVWDGEAYRFITDVLGVGGMGFFDSPGVYAPSRPSERYLLEASMLVPRDGRYHVKLTEPMEENAYLDAAWIQVFDIPRGWSMVLDERMGISGPPVTGRPITYRRSLDPVRVTNGSGENVTEFVLKRDYRASPLGDIDHRFIGLLAAKEVLTFEFAEPLDADGAVLVADGWIEYPYSQTVFAAWQAGLRYEAPTLEALDSEGKWHTVVAEFGYPAGMPRKMALPLRGLPEGTKTLRLLSNMEVYWDRLQIVWEEPLEDALVATLKPKVARVAKTGFAKRTTGDQRLPHYDYGKRTPYWDAKFQRGFYTAIGDATELVTDVDSAVAIIGGGEEVHLEFPVAPTAGPEMRRYFALEFRGWAKDMDLYTQHGETVAPLPVLDGDDNLTLAKRERLHARYNVRFQEGL